VAAPAAGGSAGQQLWVTRHSDAAGTAVAASPTGGAVFVTGSVTISYEAATGAQLWVSKYAGPAKMGSMANAVTASPDGSRVFVTGQTWNAQRHPEYATVAYDASAGTQLWASLHAGQPAGGAAAAADARAIVVSPDGKVVYVTGVSGHAGAGGRIGLGVYDYGTIAYDAATGKALWSARYDNGGNDQARAIAISPSGNVVYVTGRSLSKKTGYDDATIAYDAATGKKLWVARYNGKASKNEFANAIAVSPDGKSVYITGGSHGKTSRIDFATVGYNAATGKQLWAGRYNGPGNLNDSGAGIAVSPDNATVVVTGGSKGKAGQYDPDWATIAYNAKTGAGRWTERYGRASTADISTAVIINPGGGTVYVTGLVGGFKEDGEYGTVAYSVSTGAQKWAKFYDGPAGLFSETEALAISPDGHTLYETGSSDSSDAVDMATVAYRT
jgi:sugar lactone lactonase YvrE